MAYDLRTQISLLLGDLRGLTWSPARVDATLARQQRLLAQNAYAIEQRQSLVCTSGQRFVTLPNDHIQTYALTRGIFSVAVRLLDQTNQSWWLTVSPAGVISFTTDAPTGAQLLTTTSTYWLRLISPDTTVWYLSPSALGEVLMSTVQPGGAGSTSTVQLRDTTGTPWYLQATNLGELQATNLGSATLTATALDLSPLQRMDPEARQRADPRQSVGPPRYYGIEGKLLELDPTPDATYELEHLYYASDVNQMEAPWDTVSVLGTVAMLMYGAPSQQLLGMVAQQVAVLSDIYVPGTYDAPRDARGAISGVAR